MKSDVNVPVIHSALPFGSIPYSKRYQNSCFSVFTFVFWFRSAVFKFLADFLY